MPESIFHFGMFAPPSRRSRARRRSHFAAVESLGARLMLSATGAANIDAESTDAPTAPADVPTSLLAENAGDSDSQETAEHPYPVMDDMSYEDPTDELAMVMMTDATMFLSPAVDAPEFRGQLFEEELTGPVNVVVADPDLDDVSPLAASQSEVATSPRITAETISTVSDGISPAVEDLLPPPEQIELPDSIQPLPEFGTESDGKSAAPENPEPSTPESETESTRDAQGPEAMELESKVDVPADSHSTRLEDGPLNFDLPSLDSLFSKGYAFAVQGVTPTDIRLADTGNE